MKRLLQYTLTGFLLLPAIFSNAQPGTRHDFAYYGYKDISLAGMSNATVYYLSVQPHDNLNNGRIVLLLKTSQILNTNTSHLVCYINNYPVLTVRVQGSDSLTKVVLPVSSQSLTDDHRFVQLKIQTYLGFNDDYCSADPDNPTLWVTVQKESYIETGLQETENYTPSIKESLAQFSQIQISDLLKEQDVLTSGVVYALLKQMNRNAAITIGTYRQQDVLYNTVVAGVWGDLPESVVKEMPELNNGQGLIYLYPSNGLDSSGRKIMVITGKDEAGYQKALSALLNTNLINGSFSGRLLIDKIYPGTVAKDNSILLLEELGNEETGRLTGLNILTTEYSFNLADYGKFPRDVQLHLECAYTPVMANERAYINIYLNQNLVYSVLLNNSGSLIGDIDLPINYLTSANKLSFEIHYPKEGMCRSHKNTAEIKQELSYLNFSGELHPDFTSFRQFPINFRGNNTALIVSPAFHATALKAVGEIISYLNPSSSRAEFILPELHFSNRITEEQLTAKRIIAILQREDPIINHFTNVPLRYNYNFAIYNDEEGKQRYTATDFANSAIYQVFDQNERKVLLATAPSDSSFWSIEWALKKINTPLSAIESNVCVTNTNSYYFFQLRPHDGQVHYINERSRLKNWWYLYRWIILGVLLGLVILAFFFVKRKVTASQETVK